MKLTKLFALLALLVGALAVPPVAMAEGWFSDMDDVKEVTLGQILRDPRSFLDVRIKVKVYFDQSASNYNPFYTRFSDAVYGNFSAWPINARLYEKRDFGRPYPFFFMQRMNKEWKKLSKLKRVTAVEVDGIVREVFRGQPWIEIMDYSTISEGMRRDDIKNVVVGDAHFMAGRYKKAVAHYDDAARSRVPKSVRIEIYRKLADAEFHAGEYRDAASSYRSALKLAKKSEVLEQGLAAATDMAERKRSEKIAQKRAGLVVAPASRDIPAVDPRNDVDDIIQMLENPATVKAEVERDRLELAKRAARIREGGDVATVSGETQQDEEKQAAPDGETEEGVVVKDGVAEDEGNGEEPVEDGSGDAPAETEEDAQKAEGEPEKGAEGEKTEEVVEEEATDEVDEEMVEEAAEEAIEEAEEEKAEEAVEEATEEVTEEKTEEATEETTEEVTEEKTEEATEEATEEVAEEKVEEAAEEAAEEADEPKQPVDEPAEGSTEEVTEQEEPEEVVEADESEGCGEVEEVAKEVVKDDELRPGEVLVKDGVPVGDESDVDEGEVAEEATEESTEEAAEGSEGDDTAEEEAEQPTEEATEEMAEESAEEETDAPAEEKGEESVDGDEEKTEEVDEEVDEGETVVEDGEPAAETESDETVVEDGVPAKEAVVVKDGEVVVKDGEAVVESADEPAEAEAVEEQPVDQVVEEEPVAVPERKTVDVLPRLPFFGCEGVTQEELRSIIEEVLNNPEE